LKVFYDADFTLAAHAFETTRKARWVADSLVSKPILGVELVAPRPISMGQLLETHSPTYVDATRTGEPRALAQSQGFEWDPGLWKMVLATNGGAVAAALTALKEGFAGSLSSGLHHARRERGAGFCTFNGLALAAKAALNEGARKVLILDMDAHGGGGTYSLIKDDPRIAQIDIVTSPFDVYEPDDKRFFLEVLSHGASHVEMELAFHRGVRQLDEVGFQPDLVIYNSGMDSYEAYTHDAHRREVLVFSHFCRRDIPIAFVLAGGYLGQSLDQEGLVQLHRCTIGVAAAMWGRLHMSPEEAEREALEAERYAGECDGF
jgi:acetoin utilization deacetylase AcuC-like enzyme